LLRDGDDALHQAFAKTRFADNQRAVVILHCARDNFGSGSGEIVNQNHQRRLIGIGVRALYS